MPLAGFPRELLDRPTSERLAYFRSYTIAHPRLTAISDTLMRAIQEPAGRSLILVTGPTGSGKSTTLACLINLINQNKMQVFQQILNALLFVMG